MVKKKKNVKVTALTGSNRRAAAAGMVLAVIIGGLTLFGLLATMCSERRKRSKAWAPLSL